MGVDGIKAKFQKNLCAVASSIIAVAREIMTKNSNEEITKILLLLEDDCDEEEAEPSQGDYQ